MFRRIARIHASRTLNELVDMDFVDGGEDATFLHIQDTFSRYSMITPACARKKRGETAENAAHAVLTNWVSFFSEHRALF